MEEHDYAKALARQKRIIAELAGEIHDIVEDTLWSQYAQLPALSAKMQTLMAEFEALKQAHSST